MEILKNLFIGGEWVPAQSKKTFEVLNPATGELIVEIADAGEADMAAAIDKADHIQPAWGSSIALERSAILRRAAALTRERIGFLAELMTKEQGKPLHQSVAELEYGIGFLEWFAEEARRIYGMTIPSQYATKRIAVLKQPAGISACITPWNFPSLQILRKLGAALAAGCTMVVKPAELTPLSALEIGRTFQDAGLPDGVLSIVPSLDPVPPTAAIQKDPRVRVLSFTGSTEVGKLLMRGAAETMKRVSLELGGHAPVLVFADADLDRAVAETVACKTRNMGQTCVSANRIFVHESIAAEFANRLVTALGALKVGNGLDPDVAIGPLVEPAGVEKVERHVADASQRGAKVLLGGSRYTDGAAAKGNFYSPTVLLGVDESMLVTQEETFGPVAPVLTFQSDDEAIDRANDTPYGLAAYAFTSNLNRAVLLAERLEYGTVGINDASISAVQAPFGGMKESGVGREGGPVGMEEYLETKYVSLGGLPG